MHKIWGLGLCLLFTASSVFALTIEACPATEFANVQDKKITFWQHTFQNGDRDLVISLNLPDQLDDIKRITFNHQNIESANNQPCLYQTLAITQGMQQGQQWGWHLAWTYQHQVFYTRMDGEAWVVSPFKKFGHEENKVQHPVLFSQNDQVWIAWEEHSVAGIAEIWGVSSDDGGKTWSDAKLFFSGKQGVGAFMLLENNGKPYLSVNLIGDGIELVPLT